MARLRDEATMKMARGREPDYDDEGEVPWLAGVEEERPQSTLVSQRRLISGAALFLALLALIVGGVYAITSGKREGGSSAGVAVNAEDLPLIAADAGPYKVRPTDPGGKQVEGAGDTIYDVGKGDDPGGAIAPDATTEDPLPRPGADLGEPRDLLSSAGASEQVVIPPAGTPMRPPAPAVARSVPEAVAEAVAPLKRLPKPAAPQPGASLPKAAGSAALQLGAFSSNAKADAAWKDYAGRFAYLAGLNKSVVKVERDGATLYRLRATGVTDRTAASDLCARLKLAGEECLVAQ